MESAKYKLASESAGYGIDPSALVYLSDLMVAIELVMSTAAGIAKENVAKWIKLLRLSVTAICASFGDSITPENLLIQGLIDRRAEIRDNLEKTHSSGETTHHRNHLLLLFAFARGMGIKHELFDVAKEWEQLPFFGKDRAAQMVITALIDNVIHLHEVTVDHLDDWHAKRVSDHFSVPSSDQAVSNLKMRIRESQELMAKFPLLDVRSSRPDPCRMALKTMHPALRMEVEAALTWLNKRAADGIIDMNEISRQGFVMLLEVLCGFAAKMPNAGEITKLSQCLNRPVISEYARQMHSSEKLNSTSIKQRIHIFRRFLIDYPPFSAQNWNWMIKLAAEFQAEPESAIQARRQDRAFGYNFTAVADMLKRMEVQRLLESSGSKLEIGWQRHDEFLMQWLDCFPLQPRCMYECRIEGDMPNLFRPSDHPELVPDHLKRLKNPLLLSDDMWVLSLAAMEVPNRVSIGVPFPEQLVPGLTRYLEYRQYLIKGEEPGTLFLNRFGGKLNATTFCKLVCNITESYLLHSIRPTAFQDLAAYKWLAENPDDYSTLADLLCQSIHSIRMRFDSKYRLANSSKPRNAK